VFLGLKVLVKSHSPPDSFIKRTVVAIIGIIAKPKIHHTGFHPNTFIFHNLESHDPFFSFLFYCIRLASHFITPFFVKSCLISLLRDLRQPWSNYALMRRPLHCRAPFQDQWHPTIDHKHNENIHALTCNALGHCSAPPKHDGTTGKVQYAVFGD
jgi:hypothetical protein